MTRCYSCGGSGYFAGTYGDIRCEDCGGEGSWEDDERCKCGEILKEGECAICDAALTTAHSDPFGKAMIAHDIADYCDLIVRRASKPREGGLAKAPASNNG